MSQKYLTIVYAVNETSDVAATYHAREWIASSYSHAIDDVRALKKENANLRTDYDAVRLEIASLQAQLQSAHNRLYDILQNDDGQAHKEARKYLEAAPQPATTVHQLPIAMKTHGAWDGLEELMDAPDGTAVYAPPQPAAQAQEAALTCDLKPDPNAYPVPQPATQKHRIAFNLTSKERQDLQ